MSRGGVYCLCIGNHRHQRLRVGALGEIEFPPAKYVYVGSALNGLKPRVLRHIRVSLGRHPVVHWHIDYLLQAPGVEVEAVYFLETRDRLECWLSSQVSQHGVAVPGFGSSDCRCGSHLYRVKGFEFLGELGLQIWPTRLGA